MSKQTRGKVTVEFSNASGHDGDNQDWIERLFALGAFLQAPESDVHCTIYAYEDKAIGGLRLAEIDFTQERPSGGMAGASYMRCDDPGRVVLAYCEDFLSTYGVKPIRPEGWESFLNEHGENRVKILRAMGMVEEAAAEYQQQLAEEAELAAQLS